MNAITVKTLQQAKQSNKNFAALTAYDAPLAQIAEQQGIDVLLVGDSVGMVVQGQQSTIPVTLAHMIYHTQCVSRGASRALIMADMPFMTYCNIPSALKNAQLLMQAGAHMVKLEGSAWLAETIQALIQHGVPVCAHLGLLPQSVYVDGGYRLKGKQEDEAKQIYQDALTLAEAGAQLLLLECVQPKIAAKITRDCRAPVIGIGSGPETDGQILVLQDVLGISPKAPAFAKNFMQHADSIQQAIACYAQAVCRGEFPVDTQAFAGR